MIRPGAWYFLDAQSSRARCLKTTLCTCFSNGSLLAHREPEIRQKAELAVIKIREDAQAGSADILKWWTLMATDVVAHLSFGESFRMQELGKV